MIFQVSREGGWVKWRERERKEVLKINTIRSCLA